MILNQTSIYALRAMGFLSQHTQHPVRSSTIAKEMDIPPNFLSKILNRLVQDGLIRSIRGRNGGVILAKPAWQIRLYDIVNLFTKLDDFKKCLLGPNKVCTGSCGLHSKWEIILEQFEKILHETTVEQIIHP